MPNRLTNATSPYLLQGKLCDRQDWIAAAESTLEMATDTVRRSPMTGQLFVALDWLERPTTEVVALANTSLYVCQNRHCDAPPHRLGAAVQATTATGEPL